MNIFITGYMASGKTTFGRKLAESLQVEFIDLDNYIEEAEGKTIAEIFEHEGEEKFRNLETKYLREIIANDGNKVLACGGGTPCFNKNMELMNKNGITVFLETSTPVLISRLQEENDKRPLMAGKTQEEIRQKVLTQLCHRLPYYMEAKLKWGGDDLDTAEQIEANVASFISSYPSIFR